MMTNYFPGDWSTSGTFRGIGLRVFTGPIDPLGDMPIVQDSIHTHNHQGEAYVISTYASNMASAANKDLLVVVPSQSFPVDKDPVIWLPHLYPEFIADGNGLIFIYEGPTTTASGTLIPTVNRNRGGLYSTNASRTAVWENPTISATGTLLWRGMTAGSRNSVGSNEVVQGEFILKNGTNYLVRFTSEAAGVRYLVRLNWYEHQLDHYSE